MDIEPQNTESLVLFIQVINRSNAGRAVRRERDHAVRCLGVQNFPRGVVTHLEVFRRKNGQGSRRYNFILSPLRAHISRSDFNGL